MSFSQVIGHEVPVKILKSILKENRLGVSFLFYGPSGVGKAFAARQFAKAMNCQNQDGESCDDCHSCKKIDKTEFPDLHWLDITEGQENIKIEQIRSMRQEMNLRPFQAAHKVFIINDCHNMKLEAANCLLKVLEEPASDAIVILITSKLNLLLPTIVSRCQKIKFSSLCRNHAQEILEGSYKLSKDYSRYLAYYLDGRLGEAITLSKQNLLEQRDNILNKFLYNFDSLYLAGVFEDKDEARKSLAILAAWFRDMMFSKFEINEECFINRDRAQDIIRESGRYSEDELMDVLGSLSKSLEYLKKNINTKLLIEELRLKIWKN